MDVKLLHDRIPAKDKCYLVIRIGYYDQKDGEPILSRLFFIRSSRERVRNARDRLFRRIPRIVNTYTGYYWRDVFMNVASTGYSSAPQEYFKRGTPDDSQTSA